LPASHPQHAESAPRTYLTSLCTSFHRMPTSFRELPRQQSDSFFSRFVYSALFFSHSRPRRFPQFFRFFPTASILRGEPSNLPSIFFFSFNNPWIAFKILPSYSPLFPPFEMRSSTLCSPPPPPSISSTPASHIPPPSFRTRVLSVPVSPRVLKISFHPHPRSSRARPPMLVSACRPPVPTASGLIPPLPFNEDLSFFFTD